MSPAGLLELEHLRHLHAHLWGECVIETAQGQNKTYSYIDLTLFRCLPQAKHCPFKVLFIRDEYAVAYDSILENSTHTTKSNFQNSTMVTGQPGTGQRLFLLYILLRRLQERQPVALQISSESYALFDEAGVTVNPTTIDWACAIPDGSWGLTDILDCRVFDSTHLVLACSLMSPGWMSWADQMCPQVYVLDVWSLEDLRILLAAHDLDVECGIGLYHKFGPNLQVIAEILSKPGFETQHLDKVRSISNEFAREFSAMSTTRLRLRDSSDDLMTIFMARPYSLKSRYRPGFYIPTPFLATVLGVEISCQEARKQHAFFKEFSKHRSLSSAAQWIFESYAHVRLSGVQHDFALVAYPPDDPSPYAIPTSEMTITGATALQNVPHGSDFCWLPAPEEGAAGGIGALIRSGDDIWVLHFTLDEEPPRTPSTKSLDQVFDLMDRNTSDSVVWHVVVVAVDLHPAQYWARCLKETLTGRWEGIRVYGCKAPLGRLTDLEVQRLQTHLQQAYGTYPMDQTPGLKLPLEDERLMYKLLP